MKTPKELQSIYSKLPKTELKGKKVKLSLVDDLRKEYGKLQTLGVDADIMDFEAKYKERIPKYESLAIQFKDAAIKAEELGLNKMAAMAKDFAEASKNDIKVLNKKVSLLIQLTKL